MKKLIFVPQKTDFSCGPACIETVMSLMGGAAGFHQEFIGKALGTAPKVGTDHRLLGEWCREHAVIESMGCNTYSGKGIAIANILNPFSGNGHFVVFLYRDSKVTRYYCPLLNRIVTMRTPELEWRNGAGNLKAWSVNFAFV